MTSAVSSGSSEQDRERPALSDVTEPDQRFASPGEAPATSSTPLDITGLYVTHAAAAHQLAFRVTGDPVLAEDAVQEAFLSLWLLRDRYQPELGGIGTLLNTLVHHRAVDLIRRRASGPHVQPLGEGEEVLIAPEEGPEEVVVAFDQVYRFMRAVNDLTPVQGQVLTLTYLHGYTHSEIADLLDVPLGTVKSRIRAAKRDLRRQNPREGWR